MDTAGVWMRNAPNRPQDNELKGKPRLVVSELKPKAKLFYFSYRWASLHHTPKMDAKSQANTLAQGSWLHHDCGLLSLFVYECEDLGLDPQNLHINQAQ